VPHRLSHGKRSTGCVEAEQVGAGTHAGCGLREGLERRLMTDEAVSPGIRATVTSAAAVMIGVFSIVATLSSRDFKEMGVGASSWAPTRGRGPPARRGQERGTRIHRLLRVAGLDVAA